MKMGEMGEEYTSLQLCVTFVVIPFIFTGKVLYGRTKRRMQLMQ